MSNAHKLAGGDQGDRLDTGMKVSEAIERTQKWWENSGRSIMLDHKIRQSATGAVFASADPDDLNFLPSGIINARPWHELTKREMLRLVKFWHHFHVRMPDLIGTPEHEYKFGQAETVQ